MGVLHLVGYRVRDLDKIESEAKELLEATGNARRKMFDSVVLSFVTEPTKEVHEIDKFLHFRLDDVLKDIKEPKNEIILGSLYGLQQKFGDLDLAELLVSSGLFGKIHRYHNEGSRYEDYLFQSDEDIADCFETCEDTGETKYYDPVLGDEVSKEEFESNKYFTLVPTELYKKIYKELLEQYKNARIY